MKRRTLLSIGDNGFTLMELVVAMFVIAVMTAVVTPHLLGIGDRAEENACQQNERLIQAALTEYYLIHHSYPEGTSAQQLQTLVDEKLLQSIPEEPAGGHYDISEQGDSVEVTCDVHGSLS